MRVSSRLISAGLFASFLTAVFAKDPLEGFASFHSFLEAEANRVRTWADIRPLNSTDDLDRTVSDIVQKINAFAHLTELPPETHWADGWGSCAHPQAGILLDRQELAKLRAALPREPARILFTFVVAHETAHMHQYQEYGRTVFFQKERTRQLELQADIVAGAIVGIVGMREGREKYQLGSPMRPEDTTGSTNFFLHLGRLVGHPAWADATVHPRPDQRTIGASIGLMGGLQKIVGDNYIGHIKHRQIQEAAKILEDFENYEKKTPFMPLLDRENLKMEDGFTWSRRVASEMLKEGFNYAQELRKYRARNGVPD